LIAGSGPCKTLDGTAIATEANVELPVEITPRLKSIAQGIGLYRTEYLFLNRETLPSEEEQYKAYANVASAFSPMPVTLRTMDIGGDKFVSQLEIAKEANPQLGWRAIRFCLERPDIFSVQLRAMLRASAHGNVRIMFPMVSGVKELRQVRAFLDGVKNDLIKEGVAIDRNIKVGSMIEVPSAAVLTDILAKECDFFSIGTNDLVQYSLAVDRVNEKIAHLYEPAHPAVLRMIKWTADAAQGTGIPCGLCGEMAGNPLYTELLLGMGITSFSMAAVALPAIRAQIAQTHLDDARDIARKALAFETEDEVNELLHERLEARRLPEEDCPSADPAQEEVSHVDEA